MDVVFRVSPVEVLGRHTPSPDVRISTIQDHRRLLHVAKVKHDYVAISYVGAKELTAENIQLRDVQEFSEGAVFPENCWRYRQALKVSDRRFSFKTKEALITHLTKVVDARVYPLWYKHKFHYDIENLNAIRVLDDSGDEISTDRYTIALSNGELLLFHDLESGVDAATSTHSFFLTEYTDVNGFRRLELLRSTPVYERATVEAQDINRSYYYSSEYIIGAEDGFDYNIFFSRDENGLRFDGPWYIRPLSRHQIQAVQPDVVKPNERWSVRITDGDIVGFQEGRANRYSIPEYHLQPFLPSEPTLYTATAGATILSSKLIKLPFLNVVHDEIMSPLDIIIIDEQLNVRGGFTTGQSGRIWEGRFDQWFPIHGSVSQELIELYSAGGSINPEEGLVYLPMELASTDIVFVRGSHQEKSYDYAKLNLNPVLNPRMRNGRAIIYVLSDQHLDEFPPGVPGIGVQHIIVNSDGEITEWSHFALTEPGGEESALYTDQSLLLELLQSYEILGHASQYDLFLEIFPGILIIAEIGISRGQSPDELSFIDVRNKHDRLTDIVESNLESTGQLYPEVLWLCQDSLSERELPFAGAVSALLPLSSLEDYNFKGAPNSEFNREYVDAATSKYSALGGPVIWSPDILPLSQEQALISIYGSPVIDIPDPANGLAGSSLEFSYHLARDLRRNLQGQVGSNQYSLHLRLSAVPVKVGREGLEESVFIEEDLPVPLVDSDRIVQYATISIPESLHALIGENLYVYLTLKREGLEVARSVVLALRVRRNGELALSGHTGMMLNAEIRIDRHLGGMLLNAGVE